MANSAAAQATAAKSEVWTSGDQVVLLALAATKYYAGLMQCADATGHSIDPAVGVAATAFVLGVVKQDVDNSAGGAGALNVVLQTNRCVWMDNVAADDIVTIADLGKLGYAVDNHSIGNASANGPLAGRIVGVDSVKGVLIRLGRN